MDKYSKNEGIIIKNGKIEARNLSVGKNASSTEKNIYSTESLNREDTIQKICNKLDNLIEMIKANAGEVENSNDIIGTTQIIANELSKDVPNKLTITALLDGVASNLGSLTTIASLVIKLKESILTML